MAFNSGFKGLTHKERHILIVWDMLLCHWANIFLHCDGS